MSNQLRALTLAKLLELQLQATINTLGKHINDNPPHPVFAKLSNLGHQFTMDEIEGAMAMLLDILYKPFSQIDAENGTDGVGVQIETEGIKWVCVHGMRNSSDDENETAYIEDDEHPDIYCVMGRVNKADTEVTVLCDFLTSNLAHQFANYLSNQYEVTKWCSCPHTERDGIAQAFDEEHPFTAVKD